MSSGTDNRAETSAVPKTVKSRHKSTGFPVVSLVEARSILKEAGKYGFEHSVASFASYMGHSTTNSGAFRQRLSAFRDWKLITGRGDNLSITEVGKMIALPTDEVAELRALQEAFHNFSVFSRLYEGSAKGNPLAPKRLGIRAVHDFDIAPNRADKFIDSFIESAIAAGLAEMAEDDHVVLLAPNDDSSDPDSAVTPMSPSAPAGAGNRTALSRSGSPVVHQSWGIAGGRIIFEIRSDRPLPASAFATVGEVVASLENLAQTLDARRPSNDVVDEDVE